MPPSQIASQHACLSQQSRYDTASAAASSRRPYVSSSRSSAAGSGPAPPMPASGSLRCSTCRSHAAVGHGSSHRRRQAGHLRRVAQHNLQRLCAQAWVHDVQCTADGGMYCGVEAPELLIWSKTQMMARCWKRCEELCTRVRATLLPVVYHGVRSRTPGTAPAARAAAAGAHRPRAASPPRLAAGASRAPASPAPPDGAAAPPTAPSRRHLPLQTQESGRLCGSTFAMHTVQR